MELDKLAANGTARAENVQTAVRNLKRLARFGRMAEAALTQIKEKGWVDGKYPSANPGGYGGLGIGSCYFEAMVPPTRSMISDLTDLKVSIGKLRSDSHGGTEFKSAALMLSGTGFAQVKREIVARPFEKKIGFIRLKKDGGLSYESKSSTVVKVYSEFKSEKAAYSAQAFADDFVSALAECDDNDPSQLYNDLMQAVRDWLIDEGHVKRLCLEARDAARVLGVMSA